MTRNRELAEMYPEYEPFFTGLNNRVFDLMEIFKQQHYVHPDFRGSYSIKNILPVVARQHTYDGLPINHGMLASIRWFELVTGKVSAADRQDTVNHLRQYCQLDTLAMVEVYKFLRNLISL